MKFFREKLSRYLTFTILTSNTITRSLYNISKYSQENFHGAHEKCEKRESLAQ